MRLDSMARIVGFIGCMYAPCMWGLSTADLSCDTPLEITETVTITLDADFTIDTLCELIKASAPFGDSQQDSVIFHSTTGKKIIIADGGTWDPATFNTSNKKIQFSGNAQLVIQKGGTIVVRGIVDMSGAHCALHQAAIIQLDNGTLCTSNGGVIQTVATEN